MLMPRRLDHYARLAYMVKTDINGPAQNSPNFTDHRRPMLCSGCICVWSHISSRFQVLRRDERWRSQMIFCNFTKSRGAMEIVNAFTKLWDLNPTWKGFDQRHKDHLNPRFVSIDSETS